jgi:hypothetical protein
MRRRVSCGSFDLWRRGAGVLSETAEFSIRTEFLAVSPALCLQPPPKMEGMFEHMFNTRSWDIKARRAPRARAEDGRGDSDSEDARAARMRGAGASRPPVHGARRCRSTASGGLCAWLASQKEASVRKRRFLRFLRRATRRSLPLTRFPSLPPSHPHLPSPTALLVSQALLKSNDISAPVQAHLARVFALLAGGVALAAATAAALLATGVSLPPLVPFLAGLGATI